MEMEGINWEAINNESNQVTNYSNVYSRSLYTASSDFLNELCKVWGSGNAVRFANEFADKVQEATNMIITNNGDLINKIMEAARIYSENLNVNVTITKSDSVLSERIDHNIKETVNGVTGMNKEYVKTLIDTYLSKVKTYCDEYESSMNGISISLFDVAGVQKDAFTTKVKQITKDIYNNISEFTAVAKDAIDSEIEALATVQKWVANDFNN